MLLLDQYTNEMKTFLDVLTKSQQKYLFDSLLELLFSYKGSL